MILAAVSHLVFELLSLFLLVARCVQSQNISAVEIKGSRFFFASNGSQFFIRGVIDQVVPLNNDQGSVAANLARASTHNQYLDLLSNADACLRDIPYLQKLQTNVVRSYGLDPSKDHTYCMAELANAGIYVLADLPAPGLTIGDKNPVWNDALYDRYTQVIDAMHNFTNLLGFIIGDNVVQGIGQDEAGPFVKAAVRDMKAYISEKNYRTIPIGYANDVLQANSAAIGSGSKEVWQYLNCGDANERIAFFGGNAVSFCESSTSTDSGYRNATSELSNYSIPIFLASYGCSQALNRDFSEIQVIYSSMMSPVWSGGIIYEYFQQGPEPGYGLVSLAGADVSTMNNFRVVSTEMASISPKSTELAIYQPSNTVASCPDAGGTDLPPNPRVAAVLAGTSTTASSISPTSSSAAVTGSSKPSNEGFSTGAKAGIGIGVAVPVIVFAAVLFVLYRRNRGKEKQEDGTGGQWNKTELPADGVDREARGYNHMAASMPRAEVDGVILDREVAADRPIVEAAGNSGTWSELPAKPDYVTENEPTEFSDSRLVSVASTIASGLEGSKGEITPNTSKIKFHVVQALQTRSLVKCLSLGLLQNYLHTCTEGCRSKEMKCHHQSPAAKYAYYVP